MALYQTAVFGTAVLGPLVGGYLADLSGYRLIFGLSSAGHFLATILFLWLTIHYRRNRREALDELP